MTERTTNGCVMLLILLMFVHMVSPDVHILQKKRKCDSRLEWCLLASSVHVKVRMSRNLRRGWMFWISKWDLDRCFLCRVPILWNVWQTNLLVLVPVERQTEHVWSILRRAVGLRSISMLKVLYAEGRAARVTWGCPDYPGQVTCLAQQRFQLLDLHQRQKQN